MPIMGSHYSSLQLFSCQSRSELEAEILPNDVKQHTTVLVYLPIVYISIHNLSVHNVCSAITGGHVYALRGKQPKADRIMHTAGNVW